MGVRSCTGLSQPHFVKLKLEPTLQNTSNIFGKGNYVVSLNMKYISIISPFNFQFLHYDPKRRNINNTENVKQVCGWEGSIRSDSDFIHKIGITLRSLGVLRSYLRQKKWWFY